MNETVLLIAILGGSIMICCGFMCCYKDIKLCSREKELTSVAPI